MLIQAVDSYLKVRRACGFKLMSQGKILQNFAAFSDLRGKHHVVNKQTIGS